MPVRPVQIEDTLPGPEPGAPQMELPVAGVLTGAKPDHHVSQRRVLAKIFLEALQEAPSGGCSQAPLGVSLHRSEQEVGKAVVLDDETLVAEAAIREVHDPRDRRAGRLAEALPMRVRSHREEVCVRSPLLAEHRT